MKLTAIIFIVLVVAFSSVSAQTYSSDAVLAGGNEQLTESMFESLVDFFEWSLDTKFSGEQRAEFQTDVVENWQNGNCREIQNVFYVLELSRDVAHLNEAQRGQAQILIRDRFLKELGQSNSNKLNTLLLASNREKHGRIDNLSIVVKQ